MHRATLLHPARCLLVSPLNCQHHRIAAIAIGDFMPETIRELLDAARLSAPATVSALTALYEDPASAAPVAIDALGTLSPEAEAERVIPVLDLASRVAAPLEPFLAWLAHHDGTVRLLAAVACAERGEATGLAALVELLDDDGPDLASKTRVPIWVTATLALARLTGELVGPPLDADHHTREHAQARWRALLAARRLSWSSEEGEWS
ncbi:MAG: hypothetical protein GX871_09410 [Microbacteriaceae bacterium]|nr:hypothetical protein [Microbacteriaceae bacterium]HOA85773.1 hypothetical protein [Microbacteriaceae bacterium]HPZ34509.1 hypothetical protein [Microbacteriaceae bacterium]HQC92708.1 hypothetical protein [Microbacteriaceae bacterium]